MTEAPADKAPTVLYWENTEGGHGGAADNAQRAYQIALIYNFLSQALGLGVAKQDFHPESLLLTRANLNQDSPAKTEPSISQAAAPAEKEEIPAKKEETTDTESIKVVDEKELGSSRSAWWVGGAVVLASAVAAGLYWKLNQKDTKKQ